VLGSPNLSGPLYPPSIFMNPPRPAARGGDTVSAVHGYEGSKKQYCDEQGYKAALEDVIPYGHLLIGGDFRPTTINSSTAEVMSHVGPEVASGSYALRYAIRSRTGVPMQITKGAIKWAGRFAIAYTAYSAWDAMMTEYNACMQ